MKNQLSTKNSNAGNGQKALRHTGILVEMLWVQFQTISMKLITIKSGNSLVAQSVKNLPGPGFSPQLGKIPGRRKWQPTPVFLPGNSIDRRDWWATVHEAEKSWT